MSENDRHTSTQSTSKARKFLSKKSVAPGEQFGVPGQGSSKLISISTIVALLLLWIAVTETQLVKPLFLPSPILVYEKFILVINVGFANQSLSCIRRVSSRVHNRDSYWDNDGGQSNHARYF